MIKIEITADSPREYQAALRALVVGLFTEEDYSPHEAGSVAESATDSVIEHEAEETQAQTEERQKRKRRTKAEIEADRAREVAAAVVHTSEPEVPAVEHAPVAKDEDFDVPQFLKIDHKEPEALTLTDRFETLAEQIDMEFMAEILKQLSITKIETAVPVQIEALEELVRKLEQNIEHCKLTLTKNPPAKVVTAMLCNMGIKARTRSGI